MTQVADNFIRANSGSLGANWTAQLSNFFAIVSNAANDNTGFNVVMDFWSANTFQNDQFSQVTITTLNTANTGGPMIRASNSANTAYTFETSGTAGSTLIVKTLAGTRSTILTMGSVTVSSGDVLYLQAIGTTLTAKQNGTVVGTVTDSSITSGYPGMIGYGSANFYNLWSGGDFAAAVTVLMGGISL